MRDKLCPTRDGGAFLEPPRRPVGRPALTPEQRERADLDRSYKKLARHVVMFSDGWYLSPKLTYEDRVPNQSKAQRFLTWASAKMIADCSRFNDTGAHAVRLMPKPRRSSRS